MKRPFTQVDVFSAVPLRGNPLAVVHDAQGLTDAQMADFGRWTNLSETTFLLPPTDAVGRLPGAHLLARWRAALRRPSHARQLPCVARARGVPKRAGGRRAAVRRRARADPAGRRGPCRLCRPAADDDAGGRCPARARARRARRRQRAPAARAVARQRPEVARAAARQRRDGAGARTRPRGDEGPRRNSASSACTTRAPASMPRCAPSSPASASPRTRSPAASTRASRSG